MERLRDGEMTAAAFVLGIALVAGLAIYEGVVLWIVWGWFIVPLGMPSITVPWAIGLSLIAGLLCNTTYVPKDGALRHSGNVVMKPAAVLAFAFVTKQFM